MYKFLLPLRYMFKRRISYLALVAVVLCVFIVVIVMTVMSGLVSDFKQKNHDFTGDCVVGTESLVGFPYYEEFVKVLEDQPFINSVSTVIKSYALINPSGGSEHRGVEVIGIDPVRHSRTTDFGQSLYFNRDDVSYAFVPSYQPNLPGCILGIDLAAERGVWGGYSQQDAPFKFGLSVNCFPLTPSGALAKAGLDLVNTKTFYYSDNSQSGLARVDSSTIYLPFEQAQLLCGMDSPIKRTSWIHIKFSEATDLSDGCRKVSSMWDEFAKENSEKPGAVLLANVAARSWKEHRREFIAAMEKEQAMITVMFILVGVTTFFIVLVVFYMIISHKSKDIGVLRSLGVSRCDIIWLFSIYAFFIGLLGSAAGAVCGWLFLRKINEIESWLFEHFSFQLWDRTIYAIGDIPNRLDAGVLAVIIAGAVLACLLGAFLPSIQAAKKEPVETLQVNQL
ncbi:ABC transporter permease [Planctomycetota bacterium]